MATSIYPSPTGFTNRANSALLNIEQVMERRDLPSEVRLVLVAQIVADEPVLTDPMSVGARRRAARLNSLGSKGES